MNGVNNAGLLIKCREKRHLLQRELTYYDIFIFNRTLRILNRGPNTSIVINWWFVKEGELDCGSCIYINSPSVDHHHPCHEGSHLIDTQNSQSYVCQYKRHCPPHTPPLKHQRSVAIQPQTPNRGFGDFFLSWPKKCHHSCFTINQRTEDLTFTKNI